MPPAALPPPARRDLGRRRRARPLVTGPSVARVLPAATLVLVLAGCGGDGPRLGMPDAASEQGRDVLGLWRGSAGAALAVGALVWGLIVWSAVRYRRRSDDLPSQLPENIPIEVLYTVVPLAIVAVLFGFTAVTQERVTALVDDPDLRVEVVGFQWSWRFAYPEEGVVVTSDGIEPPTLAVPVGATVRFELDAADVNHSFWLPQQLVKRDMIQGVDNEIDVTVTRAGSWTGRCSEFCGLDHGEMIFTFEAMEPAAFDDWLDERRVEADAEEAAAAGDGA